MDYLKCAICLCSGTGDVWQALACGHVYHEGCLTQSLQSAGRTCPHCRARVTGRGLKRATRLFGVESLTGETRSAEALAEELGTQVGAPGVRELEEEVEALRAEQAQRRSAEARLQEKVDGLEHQSSALARELRVARQAFDQAERRGSEAHSARAQLEEERRGHELQIRQLKDQIQGKDNQILTLQKLMGVDKIHAEGLMEDLAKRFGHDSAKNPAMQALVKLVAANSNNCRKAKAKLREREKRLVEVEEEARRLNSEKHQLLGDLDTAQREAASLRTSLARLEGGHGHGAAEGASAAGRAAVPGRDAPGGDAVAAEERGGDDGDLLLDSDSDEGHLFPRSEGSRPSFLLRPGCFQRPPELKTTSSFIPGADGRGGPPGIASTAGFLGDHRPSQPRRSFVPSRAPLIAPPPRKRAKAGGARGAKTAGADITNFFVRKPATQAGHRYVM